MKRQIAWWLLVALPVWIKAAVVVTNPRTEQMVNPLGLDTATPRMSWMLESDQNNVMQTAYHLLVASSLELLEEGKADLWDSGKVISDASQWITYNGLPLKPNQRVWWKVKSYTSQGETTWSTPATWGVGLLKESQWTGRWIGLDKAMPWDDESQWARLSARYIRKEFALQKEIKRATLYIAGMGLYELYINGQKVGDQVLAPAPTDYRKTILYNTFDVTSLLASNNAIGVALGNGHFYTTRQNYKPYKIANFGYPKLRLNLIVEYTDGSRETIATDEKWKLTADGPIRSNNEYDGEEYDARKELGDWATVGYDDSAWQLAQRVSIPTGTLRGAMAPNMKVLQTIKPLSIVKVGDKYIMDMGQNMVGWIKMKVKGAENHTIILRFAETLQKNGELYMENLRDAKVTDTYICNGKENGAWWRPTFVYHGFRYVEIKGYENPKIEDFIGEVVSDEMEVIGSFESSDKVLNQVYRNAYWGILGNYKGLPVDCPQRNERQPWLGDRTMGSLGESYIFENGPLYAKWMRDICEAQREDGCIPDVAPAYWNYYSDNMTWPAALPMSMEMLYTQFGNLKPIELWYPNVKRWLKHMRDDYMTDDYIITKDRYGDWCMPPESLELIHSKDSTRITDGALISTAYYCKVLQLMHRFADLLGYEEDKAFWKDLEQKMTDGFNKRFLHVKKGTSQQPGHLLYPDSIFYSNNTITANLLPLAFGMVPKEYEEEVVKNTVSNIMLKANGHISCGVIGISWLLRELSNRGHADVACLLATNDTYPSWGYMAQQGATTIWELWNGNTADPKMNSGNHVMLLGDLLPWCYENLGGIRSDKDKVGYKHIVMKPDFDIQDISFVNASYRTPYGKVVSRWKKTLQRVEWEVEIPANTTAEVHLLNGKIEKIGSGKHRFKVEIIPNHAAITKDEFLYNEAPFPACHGATLVECKNGDLVAAFFGGTKEKNPDSNIWICRKPKGANQWTAPVQVADGIYTEYTRRAFSEEDLQKFAQREKIVDRLMKETSGTTKDDRAKLYRTAMLEMGGAKEAAPAVPIGDNLTSPIWMAATPKGGKPLVNEEWRKPCYNPVLFQTADGKLMLFYKIGYGVSDWRGFYIASKNNGKSWSKPVALPEGFLGPIKNKPVYVNGRMICPSSTEAGGWKFHFEISDDHGKTWKYVGPLESDPILCIQPSILILSDGRLMALGRTKNARLAVTYSNDNGDTWSKVTLSELPNNNSGTDAVTLKDGRHVVVYNDFATIPGTPKGLRTPLALIVSDDDGRTWKQKIVLEDSPISQYSYPSIIQGKDGKLHVVYTWRRERICYKEIDLSKL